MPWEQSAGGPIFGAWYDSNPKRSGLVRALNGVLRELEGRGEGGERDRAWLARIRLAHPECWKLLQRCAETPEATEVQVARICPSKPTGPYLAVWLLGFPHGATVTGPKSRLSVNLNLRVGFDQVGADARKRGVKRAILLLRGELDAVRADSAPFQGGIVHKGTAVELENFPFFKHLYASEEELAEFEQECVRHDCQGGFESDGSAKTKRKRAERELESVHSQTSDGQSALELESIMLALEHAAKSGDEAQVLARLMELDGLEVSVPVLRRLKAPKKIRKLAAHRGGAVVELGQKIVKQWKRVVEQAL
jgi:hypothetical protein